MKTLKSIIFLSLFAALCYADDPEVDEANDDDAVNHRADKLAGKFDVSADSINFLKSEFKIGYGGVSKALAMASKTDYTAEEILAMKTEDKMGWGRIAKKLELKEGKDWKEPAPKDEVEADDPEIDDGKVTSLKRKSARLSKKQVKANRKLERAQAKAERKKNKHQK